MHKRIIFFALSLVLVLIVFGCAPAAPSAADLKPPVVKLTRVEAVGVFALPWPGWPAQPPTPTPAFNIVPRFPITLSFVFEIENPNEVVVTLEQMKFDVELEAKRDAPGEFFSVGISTVYDRQSIPAMTKNPLRTNVILDSGMGAGLAPPLGVVHGQRMAQLKLNADSLVNFWWDKVGDVSSATPAYGVKVTGGSADFSSGAARKTVTFDAKWPK